MKQLQNNFTTPEQSKRLLEIGVPADSADMKYPILPCCDGSAVLATDIVVSRSELGDGEIPCWSVGRLAQITLICSGSSKVEMRFKNKDADLIKSFIDDIHLLKEFGRLDFSKLNDK